MPQAHRHPLDLPDRLRPDRDRPGLRVRLRGLPGAEGAARGRLPHDRRQLEPGDDHDRPRLRRPHVPRAARPRRRRRRARARAPRRAAADDGRPDGAQPRARARGGGRPRRARDRADRRGARRDQPRRGPRALPHGGRSRSACSVPASTIVHSLDELDGVALPAVVRPAFTLGGHGGGFAYTREELRAQVEIGLRESPIGQVLVEESVRGWDEFELEVVRDRARQRRDRLLDREPRPDGRAHGRLGHGRAADDASRRGVPGAARRRGRRRSARSASTPAARTSSSRATARPARCA